MEMNIISRIRALLFPQTRFDYEAYHNSRKQLKQVKQACEKRRKQ